MQDETLNVLSDRTFSQWDRQHGINIRQTPRGPQTPTWEPDQSAPTYLAKPASGSIPARVGNIPGKKECELFLLEYKRDPGTGILAVDERDAEIKPILIPGGTPTPFTAWVYNPYTASISGSQYTIVSQTRDGKWVVVTPPSSTPTDIWFTITSCSFSIGLGALGCDHVTAVVDHVSCEGSAVSVGDEVDVYDPFYCYFNLPVTLLVGARGTASQMNSSSYQTGLEYLLDCVPPLRAQGCMFSIRSLCCTEEETVYESN